MGLGALKLAVAWGELGVTFLQPQGPFLGGSVGLEGALQLCSPGPLAFPQGCVAVALPSGTGGGQGLVSVAGMGAGHNLAPSRAGKFSIFSP